MSGGLRAAVCVPLLFVFSACSSLYPPVELPAPVHLAAELTAEDGRAARAAVDEWTAALGTNATIGVDSQTGGCGIFVRYAREGELPANHGADAQVTADCVGTIRIRPGTPFEKLRDQLIHELGHLLMDSREHSEDEGSIMFRAYSPGRYITAADVELVAARLPKGATP